VPGVVGAKADAKLIPLAAAIDTQVDIVAGSRRVAIRNAERGLSVAADNAEAHSVEHGDVGPDKQAADAGIHRRGVAIPVNAPPRAITMSPERQPISLVRINPDGTG